MFNIALFNPVMAANAGNVIRLCANNGCTLHLIEPLGFDLEEKKLRRAGLDYHDLSRVVRYSDFNAFKEAMGQRTIYAITTKGTRGYAEVQYQPGDVLLFGSETSGSATIILLSEEAALRSSFSGNGHTVRGLKIPTL